jgi:uncharacterized protein YhaN
VRIERIRLDAFGRLSGIDTGEPPLPGLVVVLGPNEGGKSTLFHFLTSMLYGFYPASRDTNPHAPWDGAEPAGSIVLRLDGGGCADVERRLLSQPTGRLTLDGRSEDLRNRTVPWAEHVPRTVFRQVFALTLDELAGLDEETWGRVQDRIVGSMGATDLLPARRVAAELEQEAGELWRPTRRGNQRIRELQRTILSLRSRRAEAVERDRRLRAVVTEVESARERLHEARQARHLARLAVEGVQALVPIRAQLGRIAALREDAGPPEPLQGMPADPTEELRTLRDRVERLERRRAELQVERADPEAAIAGFGTAERGLLERSEAISAFLGRAVALGSDRTRLAALEQESRDLDRRIEGAASTVLVAPWSAVCEADVSTLSVAELRERVRRLQAAGQQRRTLEAGRSAAPPPAGPGAGTVIAWGVLAVVGLIVLAVGLTGGGTLVAAVGGAVAALGTILLVVEVAGRGRATPATAAVGPPPDLVAAERAEEAARQAVFDLLGGLPVLPSLLDEPANGLVAGMERIQELLRDRVERARIADDLRGRVAEADAEASALVGALALEPVAGAEAVAHLLEREVRRAERLRDAATGAQRELRRLEREQARVTEEIREHSTALDRLRRRLEDAGGGDAAEGARRVRERMQAAERAGQLQEEIERAHPDLDEIRARIERAEASGESWTTDDDDVARRKARVEELTEEVETLGRRVEGLERDAVHLREVETVDAVDGEIAALQEEEQALLLERDRRWLLARILRQADRRFREEHQPDLLRRASGYLAGLTEGRYDHIVADEGAADGRFHVVGPGLPGPVLLAPPISTGTLEQAYLALRLAIVDHLDQGLERLPLFADEVLVNWDHRRRTRGMRLLAGVAEQRQVFVFTCHPELASGLEDEGARVLRVGGEG